MDKRLHPMEQENWEEKGRYANLKIVGNGKKRRLINEKGEVVVEYIVE